MTRPPKLTVGSLFAGIGGFDLGLERSGGFEIAWQVEIDDYCQKVLAKHWPDVPQYGDIQECGQGRKHPLSTVDVLCGGFPCQPHSLAGKRGASTDERDLWPEYYRLIRELRPRYVLGENVLGLLSSESGHFFGGILRDLSKAGYDAEWTTLRASDFGAPHRRERIFIVAYPVLTRPSSIKRQIYRGTHHLTSTTDTTRTSSQNELADANSDRRWDGTHQQEPGRKCTGTPDARVHGALQPVAYPDSQRCEERDIATVSGEQGRDSRYAPTYRLPGDTQSRLGGDVTRLSSGLDGHRWPARPGQPQYEYEPARVVTERQKNRVARLKALGNAIVPQCAEWIARSIVNYEQALRATESGGAA